VDARALAQPYAIGRIVIGGAMLLMPGVAARVWVGRQGRVPGAQVVTAGVGARDLAIGIGAMRALRRGSAAAPWLRAGAFADTVDMLATLRARDALPNASVVGVSAFAGVAAAAGAWISRELD
jgi:hypothetical protein